MMNCYLTWVSVFVDAVQPARRYDVNSGQATSTRFHLSLTPSVR